MRVVVIDPDAQTIALRHVKELTLDMMQEIVGGYIEFVYHETHWLKDDFVVNEEGMINHLTPWGLGPHMYFGPAFMVFNDLDDEGESHHSDATVNIEMLWSAIQFRIKLQ